MVCDRVPVVLSVSDRNHTAMRRLPMLPAVLLCLALAACATGRAPTGLLAAAPRTDGPVVDAPAAAMPRAASPALAPAPVAPPRGLLGVDGYTRLAVGTFGPAGDVKALDDGVYGHVAFGADLLPFLAVEASLGYLDVEGAGDQQITALPALLSGRVQLPLLVFEVYGGAGVGGMFADYEFGGANDSEFLPAGTAFAGLEFGIGRLAVGLEYRYLTSGETDPGFTIEGHSGLLTLTLPF